MPLDPEETLELIDFHGRSFIDACLCENCHGPDRVLMLIKLERMRELILSLPDHKDIEFEPDTRTAH